MDNNRFGGSIKLFTCNANIDLSQQIATQLGVQLGSSEVGTFSDGEISVKINEPVRGSDVFIVQPTCAPVNEHIMELLIMIDAMKRASAGRITAVIPYFAYGRQDRKNKARDPISAKLVANLIDTAGAQRLLSMDLHCDQLQGFFDIPVDHLRGMQLFTKYFMQKFSDRSDVIAVSPDLGSVSRVRQFAAKLDIPMAIIDKRRPNANVSEVMNIIGDVKGKRCIFIDDIIDTAGSIINAGNAVMENGALETYACCTHAVLSGNAIKNLESSPFKEIIVLNTIPLSKEKKIDKIKSITVATLFADAISRIHEGASISKLFDEKL